MNECKQVLHVNFEEYDARDKSGQENNGAICGTPSFVCGFRGGKAIWLRNVFGKNAAKQYILFSDLHGIDLTIDSFSAVFWYKTFCGGNPEWVSSEGASVPGSGICLPEAKAGGVVFSNRDAASSDAPGVMAAQLSQKQYFAVGLNGGAGSHFDVDGIWQPQDGRWHQISVVCDRSMRFSVYVDGGITSSIDISSLKNRRLGGNTLTVGADSLGQYGLGNACIDEFELYAGALDETAIQKKYEYDRVFLLMNEVSARVSAVGPEYTEESRRQMAEKNRKTALAMAHCTENDRDETERLYRELKQTFDDFLLSPVKEAKLSMLMISDEHIESDDDIRSQRVRTIIRDCEQCGISVDVLMNPGDVGNGASKEKLDAAYHALNGMLDRHPDWQMIACIGNHETNYVSPDECYLTGAAAYWENMQPHISSGPDRKYGEGTLDSFRNICYGMTVRGYHFLVINTDYLTQTGNAKLVPDEEVNRVDPIRHGMYMTGETLQWMTSMLDQYAKDGKPIFVVGHFPFIDTVPLSYFREVSIQDNSIGKQDAEIRRILGQYPDLIYICGHLHSQPGMSGPVEVKDDQGGCFTEINLPSVKSSARAYLPMPAGWYLFVYDTELVMRTRDFESGEWLTAYDEVIPLKKRTLNGH